MVGWLNDVLFVVIGEVAIYPEKKKEGNIIIVIPFTALRSTGLRSGNTPAWLFGPTTWRSDTGAFGPAALTILV